MMKRRNDNAFTGLEAAIVLIAFVVVAAVFSYVMLGAGFFTAQKSQEVVHTGIGQASSSIEVVGDVYGIAQTGATYLDTVRFSIGLTSGMSPMNISAMRVHYTDATARTQITFNNEKSVTATLIDGETPDTGWVIKRVENRDTAINEPKDRVLRPGEKFLLEMKVPTSATPNTRFTITMQPEVGALTTIIRTVPASIYPVNVLR